MMALATVDEGIDGCLAFVLLFRISSSLISQEEEQSRNYANDSYHTDHHANSNTDFALAATTTGRAWFGRRGDYDSRGSTS
jgi:hypothetical protein